MNEPSQTTEHEEARFWKQVNKTEGCWPWIGYRNEKGYGVMCFRGKNIRAHRFAYLLTKGPIPAKYLICHTCDNRPCVRPDHLYVGTFLQNARDAVRRGRTAKGATHGWALHPELRPRGESHPSAKLKETEVLKIIELCGNGASHSDLGRRFGVNEGTIRKIARGINSPASRI